ncbi:right-handed parallel beta-helix repeat-containing protein [Mycolicibacterium peregrinum]|uniref:glycosyl hydrolase family 28-related protein n=1 Tax=Mycolicibacterium peregrinum TaxID=43304 RepID=UPI000A9E3864|nr:glycosyl hydrolase family 28-related protein [Mycolicibacterium peregrinum]MCV7202794.1 right-handed parallel beta-helix repeat-containing protein [Mycolicibacterium peregrinum]
MSIPRRSVLSVVPALAAMAGLAPKSSAVRPVVNVRDFGAKGDGNTDDSVAIQAAVRSLRSGAKLHFPKGSYRFAAPNPEGGAAVSIAGISHVDITFDTGAELLLDNLDGGVGAGHAILIQGPASHISLNKVKVRWSTKAPRSLGDGIRVVGYPSEISDDPPAGWSGPPAPVSDVRIADCEVGSSPQAGVILMGVSDIKVTNLLVHDTAADGLHFNACRRASVDGYTVTDNGDDGLALVTYYSDRPTYDSAAQTFAFPELTTWSNTDFTITNITVSGGRANGVRFAGADNVTLRGLTVAGKQTGAGIVVDSAPEIGSGADWQYLASRGLRLEHISIADCEMGIQLLARSGADGDSKFTDFGISASDVSIRSCSNWGVRAESLTSRPVSGLRLNNCTVDATSTTGGNGGIGLGNTRDLSFGKISVTHRQPVVTFSASDTRNLSVSALNLSVTQTDGVPDDSTPSALFDNCEGAINAMHVNWPQAPETWTPVHIRAKAQPVAIRKLSVKPSSIIEHMRTV